MIMAVDFFRVGPVQPVKFIELSCHHVFERMHETGMEDNLSEAPPHQVPGQPLLVFEESGWAARSGEWSDKVEVEARFNPPLCGECGGSLRIFHENHATYRGNGSLRATFQNLVRGEYVLPPIIGVHDKKTDVACLSGPRDRLVDQRRSLRRLRSR